MGKRSWRCVYHPTHCYLQEETTASQFRSFQTTGYVALAQRAYT